MAKTIFFLIVCAFYTSVTHTMEDQSSEEQRTEIRKKYHELFIQKKERQAKKALKKAKMALMDAHRKCINGRWHVLLDPDWKNSLPIGAPATIRLLHEDEPITDELLKELNPEWVAFHAQLPAHEIPRLCNAACTYPSASEHDTQALITPEGRTLYALLRTLSPSLIAARYSSSDSDTTILSPINAALDLQDHHFIEFVLAKGKLTQEDTDFIKYQSLWWCKTIPLARILVHHGALISMDTLETVAQKDYPAELVEFYLNKQPDLERYTSDGYNILFKLNIYWGGHHGEPEWGKYFENRRKIINLLLNSGFDLSMKYKDLTSFRREKTPLHTAVTQNNKFFCKIVVRHYLERQDAFTKSFIQFLCA